MADIDWDDVTAIAPELAAVTIAEEEVEVVSTAAQTMYLASANAVFSTAEFVSGEDDPQLMLARIYWVAHFATLGRQMSGGQVGPLISQTHNGLSRAWFSNSPAGTDPTWDKTPYGTALRTLLRAGVSRAPLVF